VTLEMNSSFIEKASTSVEVTTSLEVTTALEVTTSDDFCSCGCPWIIPSGVELRAYVEQVVVEQIHQALQVDTETLSSTIRQKVSVEDGRRSAKAVGFVGIVVIVFVFGSVLLLDMTSCASFMQTRVKKKRRPSDGKVTPE
ncbi:sushi von Willebrand factor type A EGF and pentraxin domain-containing protein 1, partial [Biomphalaria glabrata]